MGTDRGKGMRTRIILIPLLAIGVAVLANAQSASINTTRSNIKACPPKMASNGQVDFESLMASLPGMIGEEVDTIYASISGVRKMVPITLNDMLGGERKLKSGMVILFPVTSNRTFEIPGPKPKRGEIGASEALMCELKLFVQDKKVVTVVLSLEGGANSGPSYFESLRYLIGLRQYGLTMFTVDVEGIPLAASWLGNTYEASVQKGLNHWGDRKTRPLTQVSGDPHEYIDGRAVGGIVSCYGTVNNIPFMFSGAAGPMIPVTAEQAPVVLDKLFPPRMAFDTASAADGINMLAFLNLDRKTMTPLLPFAGVVIVGEFDARITKPGVDRYIKTRAPGHMTMTDYNY